MKQKSPKVSENKSSLVVYFIISIVLERITRSRSKTDSQESITSIKSTSSSRSASKKKTREVEERGKFNSGSKDEKTSVNVSNSINESESKTFTKSHNRKRSVGESSAEESKKLRREPSVEESKKLRSNVMKGYTTNVYKHLVIPNFIS